MTELSTPHKALKTALPARLVALDIMTAVYDDNQNLDQVLARSKDLATLNALDRALIRMMVTTALRHSGELDHLILYAMDRDDLPTPARLCHVLRLGLTQILYMSTPDHAAVSLAVDLADAADLSRQKGLVNAVLRRVLRERDAGSLPATETQQNFPSWLIKDWTRHDGVKKTRALVAASLTEAPLDLTLHPQEDPKIWADRLQATILPTGTLRITDAQGPIETLPGYSDGLWWVQDAAAAIPVTLFGDLKGKTVIDLCAAPGGKTAQLAAMGARVIAVEKSPTRAEGLAKNLARLKLQSQVQIVVADGTSWTPPHLVDAVLLDAPCTATGTIRRHPDILIHRELLDVTRQKTLARRLMGQAARLVKSGGTIVFAVCSLQHAEGAGQVPHFLKQSPDLKLDPITARDHPNLAPFIMPDGTIRTGPDQADPMDGFFMARFRRGPATTSGS